MPTIFKNQTRHENLECPFTELLTIMKCYVENVQGGISLAYDEKTTEAIVRHCHNSINILGKGLQVLSDLLRVSSTRITPESLESAAAFMQTNSNILEALNVLRGEAEADLRKRALQKSKHHEKSER